MDVAYDSFDLMVRQEAYHDRQAQRAKVKRKIARDNHERDRVKKVYSKHI